MRHLPTGTLSSGGYSNQTVTRMVASRTRPGSSQLLYIHLMSSIQGVSKQETEIKMLIPRELLNILQNGNHHILRHGVSFLLTQEIDVTLTDDRASIV